MVEEKRRNRGYAPIPSYDYFSPDGYGYGDGTTHGYGYGEGRDEFLLGKFSIVSGYESGSGRGFAWSTADA